jgi:hypothetical protein
MYQLRRIWAGWRRKEGKKIRGGGTDIVTIRRTRAGSRLAAT